MMSSFLTEDKQIKIDLFLNELFIATPTYGEMMDTLISTDKLNVREKVIACFLAGETVNRITMRDKILDVLGFPS